MTITDLFWACPECGARDAFQGAQEEKGSDVRCRRCGSRFRRVAGAHIEVVRSDGTRESASAAHWLDALPPMEDLLAERPIREAHATLRMAETERVIREHGRYLNRIELFGKAEAGTLRLLPDAVSFQSSGEDVVWSFEELTAIQPSSHTLQLKARGRPVASLRFDEDSVRLWEELLMLAVGDYYRRTGKGDVVEFQPRISVR
jgi:hypothetical protein